MNDSIHISVVIPAYRVSRHILGVISAIGPEVSSIFVVDDGCPDGSGKLVKELCPDSRVNVIFHESNCGVGGATITGYQYAIKAGADIIVKIDGDGQMNPAYINIIILPIINGLADYTKGNRFYYLEGLQNMPIARLLGNAALSFITKLSTGYWDIFDPTNGYTAIHSKIVERLTIEKIDRRYFFESDLLFRLNIIRAVVMDVPFPAKYADEESNLNIFRSIPEFTFKHLRNTLKRIFYNYFLRDFSAVSLQLILGLIAFLAGVFIGSNAWIHSIRTGVVATSGTVMLAALPTLVGIQLLLSFLAADYGNVPKIPLHKRL